MGRQTETVAWGTQGRAPFYIAKLPVLRAGLVGPVLLVPGLAPQWLSEPLGRVFAA